MKTSDGICFPDSPAPVLLVLEARALDGSRMDFLFSDGERCVWDRATARGSAFLPL